MDTLIKSTQTENELAALCLAIDTLEKECTALSDKISSILGEDVPLPVLEKKDAKLVPLAKRIFTFSERIKGVTFRVSNIIERCEL